MPKLQKLTTLVLTALAASLIAAAQPALAQTTLTMSSWVSPQHHLTSVVLQGWADRGREGDQRPRQVPDAAQAPVGAARHLRRGAGRPGRPLLRHRELHAGAPHPAADGRAARRRATPRSINSVAYSRIHWKYFHKVGEYKGVKLLGVFTHGPGQMFTKKPVAGINDIQGLKIRTGGGIAEAVAKALGTSAFVKPAPESYELLQVRGRRRRVLPDGVDRLVQARHRARAGHAVPGRHVQLGVRLLHERGQVEQARRSRTRRSSRSSPASTSRASPASPGTRPTRRAWTRSRSPGVKIVNADPALRGRGAEALRPDRRGLDQEGQRQGRGRAPRSSPSSAPS